MTNFTILTQEIAIVTTTEKTNPVPQENIISVEPKYSLNHNGTREDRQRAFDQNDYKLVGYTWTVKI